MCMVDLKRRRQAEKMDFLAVLAAEIRIFRGFGEVESVN